MIKAYAFDAYGTLFDVAGAINRYRDVIGSDADAMAALWRVKQLEYTWTLTLMGRYEDFRELTQRGLDFVLARYPSVSRDLRQPLLEAYWTLDAYPDAKPALEALKKSGKRMVVFSNGTSAMVNAALSSANLSDLVEGVVSIDTIRQFKTTAAAYHLVSQRLDLPLDQIALVSSNRWDVAGAVSAGMQALWCNRSGMPEEYPDFAPHRVVSSLADI